MGRDKGKGKEEKGQEERGKDRTEEGRKGESTLVVGGIDDPKDT